MITYPEGLYQEHNRNELARQSIQNQTWQDALDPQLTSRLRQPLVQPGVIGKQLVRVVQARTQQQSNRQPLLAELAQHQPSMLDSQIRPHSIVYGQRSPQNLRQVRDLTALAQSQGPQGTERMVVQANKVRRVKNTINQSVEGSQTGDTPSLQADVIHAGGQIETLPDYSFTVATSENYPGQTSTVSPLTSQELRLQRQFKNSARLPYTKDSVKTINPRLKEAGRLQPGVEPQQAIVLPSASSVSALPHKNLKSVKPISAHRNTSSGFSGRLFTAINLQPLRTPPGIQRSTELPLVTPKRRDSSSLSMHWAISGASAFEQARAQVQSRNSLVMSETNHTFINRAPEVTAGQEMVTIPNQSLPETHMHSPTNNQTDSATTTERDPRNEIDIDELADKVMRKVMRQLAVESERRGGLRWP